MKQLSKYSVANKVTLLLCLCGLVCSALALFFIDAAKQSNSYVSLDNYIIDVNDDQLQKPKLENKEDLTASNVNLSPENQQVLTSSIESNNQAQNNEKKVNINTATVEQLQQLKGIGPSKAKAIIEEREKGGPFKTIEEIMRVKGIGEKTFESIKESLVN